MRAEAGWQRRIVITGTLPSEPRRWHDQAHEHRSCIHRKSTATGGGRDGPREVLGRQDRSRHPSAEGSRSSGEGTNPEQLFSAGYSACFLGALRLVARNEKIDLDDATGITTQVAFGKDPAGGFGINAHLIGYIPASSRRRRRS